METDNEHSRSDQCSKRSKHSKQVILLQHTVLTRTAIESFRGDIDNLVNKYAEYIGFEQNIPNLKWQFKEMREDLLSDCYILIYQAEISEQEYMWHKLGGKWK